MVNQFANFLLKGWLIPSFCLFTLASAEFTSISLTGRLEGCTLEHQVNPNDPSANGQNTITIRYTVPRSSWVAVGVSPDGSMLNSEVVIGKPVEQTIRKHKISGRSVSAISEMPVSWLVNATFAQSGGITTLTYTKILAEEGEIPINPNGANNFVAAFGKNNTFGFHEGYGSFVVTLSTDAIDDTPSPTTSAPVSTAPTAAAPANGFRQVPLGGVLATTSFQYRLNRNDANFDGIDTVSIRFTCPGNVWVGVGVCRDFGKMVPAKAVIGFPAAEEDAPPRRYYLQARNVSFVNPLPDDEQVLHDPQIIFANDASTLSYTIPVFSVFGNGMNTTDEALEIRADGLPTNFNIACGMNAGPSFHRIIGSFTATIQDGNDGPVLSPFPVPSPTNAPIDSPGITPTNLPVPVPTPTPVNDYQQVPFGGVLAEDPFEYRLNRNDANADGADTLSIRFTCPGNVWVGVGVSRDYGVMVPAKTVIGFPGSGNAPLRYLNQAREVAGVTPLPDDEQVLIDPQITFANDKTTLSYTLPVYTTAMNSTDETLEVHADGRLLSFIVACGSNAGPSFHQITGSVSTSIQEGGAPVPLTPAPTMAMPVASPAPTTIVTPIDSPVLAPTDSPAASPTTPPVSDPTDSPIGAPTDAPALVPSDSPIAPTPSDTPIVAPSDLPASSPTNAPVLVPSEPPIAPGPSDTPIVAPTGSPVSSPTNAPVLAPSDSPIAPTATDAPVPTDPPVLTPTDVPVAVPTDAPAGTSSSTADSIGRVSVSCFAFLIMMGIALQDMIG